MQPCHVLHYLLYLAFIEMREHSRDRGDKLVYRLSDLFHGTVMDMERTARGEIDYADVLASLQEREGEHGGANLWLQAKLKEIGWIK